MLGLQRCVGLLQNIPAHLARAQKSKHLLDLGLTCVSILLECLKN